MVSAHEAAILRIPAGQGDCMRALLYAEIRKSWKAKRFLVSVLAFLCFFAAVYAIALKKERAYGDALVMQLHYENPVADNQCQTLLFNLQRTPKEEEAPKQREEAYYCPERDGYKCVIPLGACFFAGTLISVLWKG